MQQHNDANGRLVIHTTRKAEQGDAPSQKTEKQGIKAILRMEKKQASYNTATIARRKKRATKAARSNEHEPLSPAEKLMRNTAIACAVLLTVLALKNVDQPWSRQATEGVRAAMTMRIDLDETLGRLNFVKAIVPETALVFLNMKPDALLIAPVGGSLTHSYDAQQPWLEYQCQPSEAVFAVAGGTVGAVGQGAQGDWIVMLEHEDGIQSVYAYLQSADVAKGDVVKVGDQLGVTADQADSRLYFELREGGESIDPTDRMVGGGN